MVSDNNKLTDYRGNASDMVSSLQGIPIRKFVVRGKPIPKDWEGDVDWKRISPEEKGKIKEYQAWRKKIADRVHEQMGDMIDRELRLKECHLYVNFYLSCEEEYPDLDNLLKAFLDPLQKNYGKNNKPGANLIMDDRCIRGIKAQIEIISPYEDERVEFWYLKTQIFYIERVVSPIAREDLEKNYSKRWKSDMQEIYARQGTKKGSLHVFIDNMPGNVFSGEETDQRADDMLDIIPGYDWTPHEGELVDGCLVFQKKPSEPLVDEKGEPIKHWWLNKW